MTREQAKQNLISLGISEPTDEQVTNYLNRINSEIQKEKDKASQYKDKADKADALQKRIDELEAGNLTEIEKANKALEEANKKISDMQKANAIRDQRESAMINFKITADQAKTIVRDDGSFDYEALGKIMSEKETAAAEAKEQEIAKNQDIPGGGTGGGKDKTDAEKAAEEIGKSLSGSNKAAESIVESYM